MEGLRVSDANLVVYVHPSKSNNVSQAVLRELSTMLFKYDETFEGALLAYDVNILSKSARILSGLHPYFGVKLSAKLLLFSPKPNMLLEGKVMKLTQECIHVVVLGFSSATIIDEDIREEFRYKSKHGEEMFASRLHKRHAIKLGSMIRFMVKSLDEEILHISGSLVPDHTGSIRYLEKHADEGSLSHSFIKPKNSKRGLDVQEAPAEGGETLPTDKEQLVKSSKKRKIEEF